MGLDPIAPSTRYRPGDLLGDKYKLVREIGEGGMGSVWVARNEVLDVDVAVKLIRASLSSEQAADRLLVEARSAARIGHPNIVHVFDFGKTSHGDAYLVMELLDGESIADVLDRQQRVSVQTAIELLLPVASALSAAHAKGIV